MENTNFPKTLMKYFKYSVDKAVNEAFSVAKI